MIKCTTWNTRLCPHPTMIKKMKTFLEVEGKIGPIPMSQFRPPLPDTTPTLGRTVLWRKEREQCPIDSGLQLPSLPLHNHPYQRPHLNPKMMYQIANPYFQFQFVRAHYGLVQAKCQVTYLRTGTGCSLQTVWTMAMKINLKMIIRS